MDKASAKTKAAPAGVSIRNGPVIEDEMDVDTATNGASKRKSRGSTSKPVNYNDPRSDSEEDTVPLVCKHSIAWVKEGRARKPDNLY
jgi:DNA topoisomerase-1